MRIIHTADWHLCDRLGRVDRTSDLSTRIEEVAGLCEEHQADVILVAGDVFSEQATVEDMTHALTHLHEVFAKFFARGGSILAVTGNHDRENRIELIRNSMRLAAPEIGNRQFRTGRMYLLNRPYFGTFTSNGDSVQFVLVPYPTTSRYAQSNDVFRSKQEACRFLHLRVAEEIKQVSQHPEFSTTLPTILAAHLHVRGAEVHSLYKMTDHDDVVFDTDFLPTDWAYIALGHIHKPQCLGGMKHVRYPGSFDRLDFGERDDNKGIVLLDLGPQGLRCEPTWIPLVATPMYDVVIHDPVTELPTLAERYPDREHALVRLQVTHNPTGPSRDEIVRQLRRIFPRHTGEIIWIKPNDGPAPRGFKPRSDYRATIRDFLLEKLADDPDKDEIMELAEKYMTR
jgi:DNA repair protein SbcD/Mre11